MIHVTQGNLVPLQNINSSSCTGIYIDRGTQAGSRTHLFPFSANTPNVDDLPPNIRRTRELVEYYFENVYETKHILFKTSPLPTLPDDVWNDILANQFVDIGRIHLAYDPHTYTISTFSQWLDAFKSYSAGVCVAFPHRKEEFQTWLDNVTMFFKLYPIPRHHQIICAESVHRRLVFDSHSRTLDEQRSIVDLHSSCAPLSKSAPATAEHERPETPPIASDGDDTRRTKRVRTGVCHKWNDGCCTFGDVCRFKHVCAKCKSDAHQDTACTQKKKSKRKSSG
jgi:hypothetical protein